MRKHVLAKPPEKARLIVEIWAEAGRNPRVAAMTRAIDAEVLARLDELLDAAKARGAASPSSTPVSARGSFSPLSPVSSSAIAMKPISILEAEAPMALGVLKALFTGALRRPGAEAR